LFLTIPLFHSDREDDRLSYQERGAEGVAGMAIYGFGGNLAQSRQTNSSEALGTLLQ